MRSSELRRGSLFRNRKEKQAGDPPKPDWQEVTSEPNACVFTDSLVDPELIRLAFTFLLDFRHQGHRTSRGSAVEYRFLLLRVSLRRTLKETLRPQMHRYAPRAARFSRPLITSPSSAAAAASTAKQYGAPAQRFARVGGRRCPLSARTREVYRAANATPQVRDGPRTINTSTIRFQSAISARNRTDSTNPTITCLISDQTGGE